MTAVVLVLALKCSGFADVSAYEVRSSRLTSEGGERTKH